MLLRVSIPYANHSSISFITKKSLAELHKSKKYNLQISTVQGSNIVRARNTAINKELSHAIKQTLTGFDYILFLDSDTGISVEHVEKLLSSKLPLVGGFYQKRENVNQGCSGFWKDVPGLIDLDKTLPWDSKGLKKVDWTGCGFMLASREALEQMEYPWFRYEMPEYTLDGVKCRGTTSDDMGFCINAKNSGLDVYVDCDCKAEHMCVAHSGVISDLPVSVKAPIVEEELGKLEIELYRMSLKVEALNKLKIEKSDLYTQYEVLKTRKSILIQELDVLKNSRMTINE